MVATDNRSACEFQSELASSRRKRWKPLRETAEFAGPTCSASARMARPVGTDAVQVRGAGSKRNSSGGKDIFSWLPPL